MVPNEDEVLYEVNHGLRILQKKDSLLFGTDALLLAAYMKKCRGIAYEFGGGSGIISLLAAQREKFSKIKIFEVQKELSDISERNVKLCGFEDKISVYEADIRNVGKMFCEEYADVVFSNPPYMTKNSGKKNENEMKYISRHEVYGGIYDFCRAAYDVLKYGGSFYCVYRCDRMTDLLCAMRNAGLEPKRMTFVQDTSHSRPSMILTEAKKGGGASLFVTKPLILKNADGTVTEDAEYVYTNGEFNEQFRKK